MKQSIESLWTGILKGQEPKDRATVKKRIIASILTALSGLLLYLDKVFLLLEIEGENTFGFKTYSDFIWVLMQSSAGLLALAVIALKLFPYKISLIPPVFCYGIQLTWVFRPDLYSDNIFLYVYATSTSIVFFILIFLFNRLLKFRRRENIMENKVFEESKEIIELLKTRITSEL